MKIKTNELTREALGWAVAHAQGAGSALVLTHSHGCALILSDPTEDCDIGENYQPSINWAQGGPIIERERISFVSPNEVIDEWEAIHPTQMHNESYGPTPLIAAMRCYVASKCGDEVDIPDEILETNK